MGDDLLLDYITQFTARHCKNCSFNEFCTALYEVLCKSTTGYKGGTAKMVHELYTTHKICAITVAEQAGFRCFEEMLRSDKLKHVVFIESYMPEDDVLQFVYRAAKPNQAHPMYQTFRKIYKDGIAKRQRPDAHVEDDNKVTTRKLDPKKPASIKVMVEGELISYETESSSSVEPNTVVQGKRNTDEGKNEKKVDGIKGAVDFEQADGDAQMFGAEKQQQHGEYSAYDKQKQDDRFFKGQYEQMATKNDNKGGRNSGKDHFGKKK